MRNRVMAYLLIVHRFSTSLAATKVAALPSFGIVSGSLPIVLGLILRIFAPNAALRYPRRSC